MLMLSFQLVGSQCIVFLIGTQSIRIYAAPSLKVKVIKILNPRIICDQNGVFFFLFLRESMFLLENHLSPHSTLHPKKGQENSGVDQKHMFLSLCVVF